MDAPYRRSKEMNEVVKNAGVAWADAEVARLDGVIKENDHADDKAARARLLEYRDALKSAPAAAKERVGSEGVFGGFWSPSWNCATISRLLYRARMYAGVRPNTTKSVVSHLAGCHWMPSRRWSIVLIRR